VLILPGSLPAALTGQLARWTEGGRRCYCPTNERVWPADSKAFAARCVGLGPRAYRQPEPVVASMQRLVGYRAQELIQPVWHPLMEKRSRLARLSGAHTLPLAP
jgi:hypothetical protein